MRDQGSKFSVSLGEDSVPWLETSSFFAVFIISSTLLKKVVVMMVIFPHFFGLNRTPSDSKLNFRKESASFIEYW